MLTDAQIEAAEVRGRELVEREPCAVAARFDRDSGRIELTLANGCAYAFPAHLVQDLQMRIWRGWRWTAPGSISIGPLWMSTSTFPLSYRASSEAAHG
jgi:hypothetical protein